ncbi:MAG TPA: hypothetical protein VJ725_29635 [Thermoanaerobaculia bacterium]|nr:hypothetical protein [Thermoanaerobaculia bacterium]
MKKWWKAPALHMLALGALLFGLTELVGGGLSHKKRIEIPAHRLEAMRQDFVMDTGRPPTGPEWQQMVDMQVDDEVLYQYALALGMHENSAAQARLAQIAEFVEANPHEATPSGKAHAAMELGLHEGDLVVRRILVDSAKRLIRGVVLLQKPKPDIVEQFYNAHAAELTRPARIRISQVAVNGFVQRTRKGEPAGCSRGSAQRSSTSGPRWRWPMKRRRRCISHCRPSRASSRSSAATSPPRS